MQSIGARPPAVVVPFLLAACAGSPPAAISDPRKEACIGTVPNLACRRGGGDDRVDLA
jgi:hypothetical protein